MDYSQHSHIGVAYPINMLLDNPSAPTWFLNIVVLYNHWCLAKDESHVKLCGRVPQMVGTGQIKLGKLIMRPDGDFTWHNCSLDSLLYSTFCVISLVQTYQVFLCEGPPLSFDGFLFGAVWSWWLSWSSMFLGSLSSYVLVVTEKSSPLQLQVICGHLVTLDHTTPCPCCPEYFEQLMIITNIRSNMMGRLVFMSIL